jgi:hypothetical protein
LDESHHAISNSRRLRWIEEAIRGLDTQVMRHVDHVQDERDVDDVLTDDDVEKAEWRRMGQRPSGCHEER